MWMIQLSLLDPPVNVSLGVVPGDQKSSWKHGRQSIPYPTNAKNQTVTGGSHAIGNGIPGVSTPGCSSEEKFSTKAGGLGDATSARVATRRSGPAAASLQDDNMLYHLRKDPSGRRPERPLCRRYPPTDTPRHFNMSSFVCRQPPCRRISVRASLPTRVHAANRMATAQIRRCNSN
jgi:hypothetical protein